jgi:hypothetical protein
MAATQPVQQQQQTFVRRAWTLQRVLYLIGAVMFVLASFAAGGHSLANIPAWTWGFASFSAWMLTFVV